MQIAKNILFYILIGTMVLILGGLSGWYAYLRSHTAATTALDSARGLHSPLPAFPGDHGSTAPNASAAGQTSAQQQNVSLRRLWQVDKEPVAGAAFEAASAASSTPMHLYYVERGNGYLFTADAQAQKTRRLTLTLMPKIYEAIILPAQKAVLLRSVGDSGAIATFAGSFASTTSASSSSPIPLTGHYLAAAMRRIVADPKSGALFYLTNNPLAYGTVGFTVPWNGTKPKQVFSSPLPSWEPQFSGGQVLLVQSAADDVPGYAHMLKGGSLTLLFGPVPGLLVLPHPSENAYLYSASSGGALTLFAKIGKSAPATLPLHTVAQKCVWATGKSLIAYCAVPASAGSTHFLDDWYQGALHTADTWWQVDASAGTAEILYSMPRALDVQNPIVDPSGNYIAFLNGSDQSLWVLRIAQ